MTSCTHDWEIDDWGYSSFTSYSQLYKCKICKQEQNKSSPGIGSISFLNSWYKNHNHHQDELAKTTCPGCVGIYNSFPGDPRYKEHPPNIHCSGCTCDKKDD